MIQFDTDYFVYAVYQVHLPKIIFLTNALKCTWEYIGKTLILKGKVTDLYCIQMLKIDSKKFRYNANFTFTQLFIVQTRFLKYKHSNDGCHKNLKDLFKCILNISWTSNMLLNNSTILWMHFTSAAHSLVFIPVKNEIKFYPGQWWSL